ncbi:MAG: PepSY domain-containing protein [Pseudomonadota bacterium]|nr:PepSY domain-containing protein [Pseudomonadota bacterium]
MQKFLVLGAIAALAATTAIAAPARHGLTGAELAPQARVTLAAARAAALKAHPGVITDQELEKEAGGTGLRYSFDIKSHGKTFEVGVDAVTGRVLENAAEGPHPD